MPFNLLLVFFKSASSYKHLEADYAFNRYVRVKYQNMQIFKQQHQNHLILVLMLIIFKVKI